MPGTRNAIRYNSVGVFLTESPAYEPKDETIKFLNRVQSASLSLDIQRQNVQHIGSDNFLDRKIVSAASVNLNLEYLLTDGYEEDVLGFNLNGSPIIYTEEFGVIDRPVSDRKYGSLHNNIQEDKTAFLVVGEEHFDLTGYANREHGYSGLDVIGIGNCFVTNYSISASVGDFAKASVDIVASDVTYDCIGLGKEGQGEKFQQISDNIQAVLLESEQEIENLAILENGGKIFLEASDSFEVRNLGGVNPPSMDLKNYAAQRTDSGFIFDPKVYKAATLAIPPGGISVNVKNINVGGPVLSDDNLAECSKGYAHIQSFDISIPFEREDLEGFQSMHVFGRKIKYPQIGTISFSIISSAFEKGKFSEIFCDDEIYQIEIDLNNQCKLSCLPVWAKDTNMKFTISNAKLDSYTLNESIGSYATFDCSFSFDISKNRGIFIDGTFENSRLEKCGPDMLSSPRNMEVSNVSPLGEKDTPTNIGIVE